MKATPTLEKFNKQLLVIGGQSSYNEEMLESSDLRSQNEPGIEVKHFVVSSWHITLPGRYGSCRGPPSGAIRGIKGYSCGYDVVRAQ